MRHLDPAVLSKRIEEHAADDILSGRVGGIALSVCQDGETVYENFFGSARINEKKPITQNTIFRIASMTKPITAVATLILAEKGALELSDPIEKHLPFFKDLPLVRLDNGRLTEYGRLSGKPTIFNILTHTSGIGGGQIGSAQYKLMSRDEKADLWSAVKFHARAGVQFEPFTEVLYSGTASFDVLAAIIEKLSDMNYEEFLKKYIFSPLGMTDTTFLPSEEQWERMIEMHDYVNGKSEVGHSYDGCVFEDFPVSHFLGGAGLVSTLRDYSRFAEMLLNEGQGIISQKSVKLMSTPMVPYSIQQRNKRWGLSVKVVTDACYKSLPLGAYGWAGAYGTHFWVDPENRITAVYMKNSQYDGGGSSITGENFEYDVTLSLK